MRTIKRITVLITALLAVTAYAAEPPRFLPVTPESVFFVGNSFTSFKQALDAYVPNMALAAADPDTIITGKQIVGGKDLKYHWNQGLAQQQIRAGGWDAVVLQEFNALTPGSAGLDTFFHYSALFDALIDSIGAQTVFYMTHDNVSHNITYIQAGNDSAGILYDAVVVPAGLAHELVKAEHPYLDPLLDPGTTDNLHPGWVGRYLNVCVFYTAFTRKSPVDIDYDPVMYPSGLYTHADAQYVRSAAWDLMRAYIEPPCTDASAPTVPDGLTTITRTLSSIGLTWNESSSAPCGVRKYNVYRDGTYAGSAYQPVFIDTNLAGGTTYEYAVSALSLGGVESAVSPTAAVTTFGDTIPPELVLVPQTRRATLVTLIFSETLDSASATDPGNYAVTGGVNVTAATLNDDGTRVSLTVTPLTENITYTVTVTGVTDNSTSKNAIAPDSRADFTYLPLFMMDDCIGYWPFELTPDDYSPSGLDATWTLDPSYGTGHDRYGILLAGDDEGSHPRIPYSTIYRSLAAQTLALWFKKGSADEEGIVLYKNDDWELRVTESGFSGWMATADTTATFTAAAAQVQDTEWHHAALTYGSGLLKLYLDAREILSIPLTGSVNVHRQTPVHVGNHFSSTGGVWSFYGGIDEVRWYRTALDSGDVAALFTNEAATLAAADSTAVQEHINQNAVTASVGGTAVTDPATGRVLAIDFDSLGIFKVIPEIGQLTAMRAFHCTGNPAESLLTSIDPAIGNCTALETLVLADNALTGLPDEITGLTNLTLLDVGNNKLCDVSMAVRTWLDTYDPDWAGSQTGCTGMVKVPGVKSVDVTSPVYFTTNGIRVTGLPQQTGIYLIFNGSELKRTLIIR